MAVTLDLASASQPGQLDASFELALRPEPGAQPPEPEPEPAPEPEPPEEPPVARELAEVERAIAVLEGRDPDLAVGVACEKQRAAERRDELTAYLRATRKELARAKRKARIRKAALAAGGVVLVGLGVRAAPTVRERFAEQSHAAAAAARIAEPLEHAGLRVLAEHEGPSPRTFALPADTCVVAVASTHDAPARVQVERPIGPQVGKAIAAFCTCGPESATISASAEGAVALRVLAAPAEVIGGVDRLAGIDPVSGHGIAEIPDRACAERHLDAWVAASPAASAPESLNDEERALAREGLVPVARTMGRRPFVAVPPAKASCYVARSREPSDDLVLRLAGGERPVRAREAGLGFCAAGLEGASVWREGTGDVSLFAIPLDRSGGLVGLREAADRAGFAIAAWTPPDDRELDARTTLTASGLPPDDAAPFHAADEGAPVFVAISTGPEATFAANDVRPGASCLPMPAIGMTQAACIEARPGTLAATGLPAARAAARKPFWLSVSSTSPDEQIRRALELFAFSRRMRRLGFEMTSVVGVERTPDGASVTGRSGEKEIVAAAVADASPWFFPLTDGDPWDMDGEPRIVAVRPGESVNLVPAAAPSGADGKVSTSALRGKRYEVLVWRR